MSDSDVQIVIGADASGVAKAAEQAKAAIAGIAPQAQAVSGAFQAVGKSLQAALAGAGVGARESMKTVVDQLAAAKAQIAEKIAAIQAAAAGGQMGRGQEQAQIAALQQQEVEAEQAALDQRLQIEQQALQAKQALYAADSQAYAALQQQLDALAAQHAAERARIAADGLKLEDDARRADLARFRTEWSGVADPMVAGFTRGLMQMAEGVKSFAQVMRSLGQQILTDFIAKVVDPMIEQWLFKELAQTMATKLGIAQRSAAEQTGAAQSMSISGQTALKDITNSAATAAGDAYKAMAGIPVVGPALGAAAAAAVFGAVIAFKGMIASAAGGYDVPAGVNPVTQLHAQEMVLPARLANPMREMLSGVSAGPAKPASGAGAGDTHVHNWSVSAMDGPSFERFLRAHGDRMVKVLSERVRANAGVTLGYAR